MSNSECRTGSDDVTPGAESSGVRPIPPRYWWLKRLSIGFVGLVVLLVLARIWWGFEADRRMRAAIEACRATGEPLTIEEIDALTANIPDEDNAAILYEQALKQAVFTTPDGVNIEDFFYGGRSLEDDAEASRELYELNAPALALLRQARGRGRFAWSYTLADMAKGGILPLSSQRSFAKILKFAAAYEFDHGNHAAGLETLNDLLGYGEAVGTPFGILSSLVSWASISLVPDAVQEHGHRLDEVDSEARNDIRRVAGQLIHHLLDLRSVRENFALAQHGERAWIVQHWQDGSLDNVWSNPFRGTSVTNKLFDGVCRPAFVIDAVRYIHLKSDAAELARDLRYQRDAPWSYRREEGPSWLKRFVVPITDGFADRNENFFRLLHQLVAERRMAAIALAIGLYRLDHGAFPETLEELVPDYLETLPEDPFAEAGVTFRYEPRRKHPVLYSIGDNGIDDGGDPPFNGLDCGRRCDFVFFLNGEPGMATSTNATSQQTDNEHDAGDDQSGQNDENQPSQQ